MSAGIGPANILRIPVAIFQSDLKETIKRLANKEFASLEERDQLLTQLRTAEGVRARDVMWMLFRPDRALREAGVKVLQRARDPETLDLFLSETRGKPEAATRAAVLAFFEIGIAGVEARIAELLKPAAKETKESREIQETARKLLLEIPVTKSVEALLWQLEGSTTGEHRAQIVVRLTTAEFDERALQRWQKLAADREENIRHRALDFLARKAPSPPVALFVEQLSNVDYTTQQVLIEALTRAAPTGGADFVENLLPLIASGEPATRSAVMKILIGLRQPALVIRKYIQFAKTLAPFVRERALEALSGFGND